MQNDIDLSTIQQYYHVPMQTAANTIGVHHGHLKRECRKHGIYRWPHRKLAALNKLQIHSLNSSDPRVGSRISAVSAEINSIMENPDHEIRKEVKAAMQAMYKANHRRNITTNEKSTKQLMVAHSALHDREDDEELSDAAPPSDGTMAEGKDEDPAMTALQHQLNGNTNSMAAPSQWHHDSTNSMSAPTQWQHQLGPIPHIESLISNTWQQGLDSALARLLAAEQLVTQPDDMTLNKMESQKLEGTNDDIQDRKTIWDMYTAFNLDGVDVGESISRWLQQNDFYNSNVQVDTFIGSNLNQPTSNAIP